MSSPFDIRKTGKDQYDSDTFVDDVVMDEGTEEGFRISLEARDVVAIAIRLVVCASAVVGLMFWEQKTIRELNIKNQQASSELDKLKSEKGDIEKQITGFDYVSGKSEEFMKKMEVMQGLAEVRLLAVEGLDQIQTALPEKVWLERVSFRGSTFTIDGVALNDMDIQIFVKSLEEVPIFGMVRLSQSVDAPVSQKQMAQNKQFSIESVLRHR